MKDIYRDRIVRSILPDDKKKTQYDDIDEQWLGAALGGANIGVDLYTASFPPTEIAALFLMDLIRIEDGRVVKTEAGSGVLRWERFMFLRKKKV